MQPLRTPVDYPLDEGEDAETGFTPPYPIPANDKTPEELQVSSHGPPADLIMLPEVNKRGKLHVQPQTFMAEFRPLTKVEL